MNDDFRLPDSVKPKHYALTLEPDLDAGTYTGSVSIDLDIKKPTETIALNAVGLDLKSDASIAIDEKSERATLTFGKPFKPGPARIQIEFKGKLSAHMRGLYRSQYAGPDGKPRVMATTQFEAASARRAFPCFDEPALKATFDVELVVPKDRIAISNTAPVSEKVDGKKRVKFARTPVMSTYLLAFIVGEFDSIEAQSKDGTLVRVLTTPGRSALGRFALETAVRGLDFFGGYYAIPYREAIAKVDLIAVPDFEAGAMENWGAITFREVALFIDPEKSSVPAKRRVAEVVLHELAHQWFGNLVTMQWWNELWLNESFATFMAFKAADALFPEWNVWEEYLAQTTSGGKSLDSLRSSHPVEVPVKDPGEVDQIFDAISYNKGGSLLRMLETTIGADPFRDGIRRYLTKHRYGNASTRDLWNALSEGTKWDVAAMMAGWTGQTGYPVVVASRKRLRQERFLLEGRSDDPTLWTIPISALDADGKIFSLRLDQREADVDAKWTKLNAGQAGFYLVHYDADTRPKPAGLSTADRYGLIEDATSLMRAGYLSVSEYLRLVGSYGSEENYNVWAQLAGGLSMLADIFVGDPNVPKLEAWAHKLFGPIAKKVGWEKRADEAHHQVLLRTVVLGAASRFGDPGVVEEARKRFQRPEAIAADLRPVVFGAVARHGNDAALDALVKQYESADLPEVKVQLLSSMGGFRQQAPFRRAFAYSLSEKVRPQDAMYVVAGSPIETRGTAWALVKENWKTLDERYGQSGMIARFIQSAAAGIPSEDHARDVEAFFKDHPAPYATERIKQTLEGIRVRAKFRQKNSTALSEFFRT